MSCFRNLCVSKREMAASPSDEARPARPTTPRRQVLSKRESTPGSAVSSLNSSPKLSSSMESVFSEGKKSELTTEHLPLKSSNVSNETGLRIEFLTGFGRADRTVADGKSEILTGIGAAESHSALFGLMPDKHKESDAGYGSPKPKPAHSAGSEGAALADSVTETIGRSSMSVPEVRVTLVADNSDREDTSIQESGMSHRNHTNNTTDTEPSTGWAVANSSVATKGTSSMADSASTDAGASA